MPTLGFLFIALQKKRKKKREKKREKKKEKKRFPIKGAKLKQVGNENFSPQGWKNGKIDIVVQDDVKRRIFQKYTRTSKTTKQARKVSVQWF